MSLKLLLRLSARYTKWPKPERPEAGASKPGVTKQELDDEGTKKTSDAITEIDNMTGSRWISLGALVCGLAVGLGAFAAHGLNQHFAEKYAGQTRDVAGQTIPLATKFLADFKTGAEYQMYHGLAIIAAGLVAERRPSRAARSAAWAFLFGIVLFSGSLYLLTLTGVTKWGMVTPFGGVAFLIGWAYLAIAALKQTPSST